MPNELFQNALSTSNSLSSQAQVSGGIFPNLLDARLTDLVGDRFSPNLQDRSQGRSSSTLDQAMITGWASSSDKVTVADADDLPSSAIDLDVLKGMTIQNGSVGNTDASDFYRFSLTKLSTFNLALTNLTADADVKLFKDLNDNGAVDIGEEIKRSDLSGTADEFMNLDSLGTGTYFVQVYQFSGNTAYSLRLSNSDVSEFLTGGVTLGALNSTQTVTGSFSSKDTTDLYRFTLGANAPLNLSLTGLSADADVRVIRDANNNGIVEAGEEVARSQRGKALDESINLRSLAAGTYFAQVYQFNGYTSYTLNLSNANPSNLLPTEVNLGALSATQTVLGSIYNNDTADIYRFSLDTARALTLNLSGLNADSNLRLIRDANNNGIVDVGEVLASSNQSGTSSETLTQNLQAGAYFVQVYQYSGETNYSLNLTTAAISVPVDPGNTLATARNIGILNTLQTFNDYVGSGDANDFYRFTLNGTNSVNLNLSGLSADADLQLIQDVNGNGAIDSGEILASSTQGSTLPENLIRDLTAGTYFIHVFPFSGSTNYTLTASATPNNAPADNAGNTLATARNIGILNSLQTFSDYVGSADANDFYRFTLNGTNSVSLNLSGLSADADFQLIQDVNGNGAIDSGEILAYPWQNGTLPESLAIGLAAGNYYIRVFPYSGSTTYTLTASATPIILPTGYNLNYGYGLVNAAAVVAQVTDQSPYANVPNLGGNSWSLDLVNAPEVWAQGFRGQGVVVAVVDSGVDYTHPDLDANIWVNSGEVAGNGIDDDGNGYIDDVRGWDFVNNDNTPLDLNGHGTHVAGTIAAENNGTGSIGVAYNARIMPVRVLDADGSGTWGGVAAGIRYAANNGARVINLSLGGGYSNEVASAVQYAAERGAIVVMASGNEFSANPGFPANLATQWGIAVGAVNINSQLANFSNDAGLLAVNYVVAPGVDVYSTLPNNRYENYSGTSMAAPHVAGVVALMLSARPNLTTEQAISALTNTATRTGITV